MRIRLITACLFLSAVLPPTTALAEGAPPAPAKSQAATKAGAVLTLAEAPLRLIRGSTVYKAGSGAALQKDDILETGTAGAQVETGPGAILALGPQTRVLLAALPPDARGITEVALLQGWIKLQAKGGRASVDTPVLQVNIADGSTIVRAGAQASENAVFAEEGEQQLTRLDKPDARAKAPLKLAAEQYAALQADKPQLVSGRPPHDFVAALPPAFRDRLARVPNLANAGKAAPVKEHEADFADVQPWLQAALPQRKNFVARFKPRLADPAFRKALDGALGQSAEWKPVLHPAPSRINQETTS